MITFSIEQIRLAAMDILIEENYDVESLYTNLRGMKILIDKLQSKADEKDSGKNREPKKAADSQPGQFIGYGAKLKRAAYGKLLEIRRDGAMTMEQLAKKSDGLLTVNDLVAMVEGRKMPFEKWTVLADTLGVEAVE